MAMPIGDIPGWRQGFADDFRGTSIDTSKWFAYSGQPGGDPAGWWEPSHVVVGDCMVTLRGYKDPASRPGIFVTGGIGLNSANSGTYGKYLIRMRRDKGDGISAIALLWPRGNTWPPEIDFYEDYAEPSGTTATLHCGANGDNRCQIPQSLAGYDATQWHTVGVEWSPGKLVYTVDGTAWATVTDAKVPSIPMFLAVQTQSLVCSRHNTCLSPSTPAEVDLQVDWVAAYYQAG
jgi:beta-glucanase (GH16 family)